MSRGLDREEEKEKKAAESDSLSRSGGEKRARVNDEDVSSKLVGDNRRERVALGAREYRIRESEFKAIQVTGMFRVVDSADLVRGVYNRREQLATADVRSLRRQGLLRQTSFSATGGERRDLLALSQAGRTIAELRDKGSQVFYSEFVKPAELSHDSLLYRAYLHEARRIADAGGSVRRVVLDYELKAKHFSRVNRPEARSAYRKIQAASAQELHLPIVDGHVVIPDFQIECEDERGEPSRVNVEVATGNYRGKHLGTKAAAGFQIYGEAAAGGRFSVEHGPRLKGNIFPQERYVVFPL